MIDVKKVISFPDKTIDVIIALARMEQNFLEALHIFESIIDNPTIEDMEWHHERIKKFLIKFQE